MAKNKNLLLIVISILFIISVSFYFRKDNRPGNSLDQRPDIFEGEDAQIQNELFQEVKYLDNSIVITFPDRGVRYSIELNSEGLGLSYYSQILTLKPGDLLKLIHKDGSYEIIPVIEKSKIGLNVTSHFYWGEKRIEKNTLLKQSSFITCHLTGFCSAMKS